MRKILLVLLGLPVLMVGATLLWTARGPVPKYEITTGSGLEAPAPVAVEAPEAAPEAAPEDASEDALLEEPSGGGTTTFAAPPFGGANAAAAPGGQAAPGESIPLTSDLVLDEAAPILIEPLDPLEARAEAEESRGGPVVPAPVEQRVVEMEWPSQFRVGGSGTVRVKLKMLDDGSAQPIAEIAGNEIAATPILIADRYDTHHAQLTATISAPNFEIEALAPATQTMERGGEAQWLWTLSADSSGRGVIAVGITLTWISKDSGLPETTVSLWGQALEAEVNYVFGSITVPQASVAGTVLAVVGFVAQIPLIDAVLEVIGKLFFGGGRRRSGARQRR